MQYLFKFRLTCLLITFLSVVFSTTLYAQKKVIVIPIEGEINYSILKFLQRSIPDAINKSPKTIIFKINTFGGAIDTTYEIVDLILSIPPSIETIAVIKKKAISAGTLIALASQSLYMMGNSILGDVAPIVVQNGVPQTLGEKIQSPLRAKFRSLAQRNGYPVKLSEAFVTAEIEIIEAIIDSKTILLTREEYQELPQTQKNKITEKKTLVKQGELLTMSDSEALELGFSKKTISTLTDLPNLSKQKFTFSTKTNSEEWFNFFYPYSFLFILIGVGGIYMEIKTPGFGVFGMVAITSLMIFFFSYYIVELANYIELFLMLLSIALIIVEIFILPGMLIFGITGFTLLVVSLVLMMQNFTIPVSHEQWEVFKHNSYTVSFSFLGSTFLFLASLIFWPKILKNSPLVFNKANNSSSSQNNALSNSINTTSNNLIGKKGTTFTPLRPSGKVIIDGELLDASSEGEAIENQIPIVVTKYQLNTVYVKKDS